MDKDEVGVKIMALRDHKSDIQKKKLYIITEDN